LTLGSLFQEVSSLTNLPCFTDVLEVLIRTVFQEHDSDQSS